jgi:Fe-S oxidoreductase
MNEEEYEEDIEEEYEEEMDKNLDALEKFKEFSEKLIEILKSENLTLKGKAEQIEKLRIENIKEYAKMLKELLKNELISSIIDKIDTDNILRLDKEYLLTMNNMIENPQNKTIKEIINMFLSITNKIKVEKTPDTEKFTFIWNDIILMKIIVDMHNNNNTIKLYLNDDWKKEIVKISYDKIDTINIEYLIYQLNDYLSTIRHLLDYYANQD